MNIIAGTIAAAALALATAASADPIAYPGSAWGVLSNPSSVIKHNAESNDWIYSGKITQGADWAVVKGWTFDTYASVNYTVDSKGIDWNNKIDPALGVKFYRPLKIGAADGVVDIGAQVMYERRFGDEYKSIKRDGLGIQFNAGYWFGWGERH